MIKANDPHLKSWLYIEPGSDFPIQNIPFGIFKPKNRTNPRVGTRLGNFIIDLAAIAELGYFKTEGIPSKEVFERHTLNDFIALGKPVWRNVREKISEIFNLENREFWNTPDFREDVVYNLLDIEMLMPVSVGDYTDFYSSIEHATNVGKMFRDPSNPLLPNWKHIPVGYHGRSSSIVISGTNIHRPMGQIIIGEDENPIFSPSRNLDFELELAFISGKTSKLGERISTKEAVNSIFGLVLFNDLSARDIQRWEYVPLGPFLSKNFGSVISPWVVTLDALEPFRIHGPKQDIPVLPYLEFDGASNYDIHLEVFLQPEDGRENRICRSNFKYMYWNMFQQLAHQTVGGCNINVGDLYGSGTISGPTHDSFGSMLELSWKGTKPILLSDGSSRKFLEDNDTVIFRGHAEKDGIKIGFGEATTKILPAIQ
jgi:fumarylacetoacetase